MEGLWPMEEERNELVTADGGMEGIIVEENSQFIPKALLVWLNQREGIEFVASLALDA